MEQLIRAGLRNPVLISVREKHEVTPATLANYYQVCQDPKEKLAALLNFMHSRFPHLQFLFTLTQTLHSTTPTFCDLNCRST